MMLQSRQQETLVGRAQLETNQAAGMGGKTRPAPVKGCLAR
jgi:hypothetical protein